MCCLVAQYQSSTNDTCTHWTTGPRTSTWVSRQGDTFGIEPQIFIADVVAAHVGDLPVHDHDFPVVAEVELEPVVLPLPGVERNQSDPGLGKGLPIGFPGLVSDLVIQDVAAHPGAGLGDQRLLEALTEIVVAQDVELHEHVLLGRGDALEDGRKRPVAVDQQPGGVADGEGQSRQALEKLARLPIDFRPSSRSGSDRPGVAARAAHSRRPPRAERRRNPEKRLRPKIQYAGSATTGNVFSEIAQAIAPCAVRTSMMARIDVKKPAICAKPRIRAMILVFLDFLGLSGIYHSLSSIPVCLFCRMLMRRFCQKPDPWRA